MPNQTQPQPPEGCVYGPWWDVPTEFWLCIAPYRFAIGGTDLTTYAFNGENWHRSTDACEKELLRVAAERDELRAEVEKKDRFIERWKVEVDDLQAEIERLKKDLEWEKRI